MSAITYSYPSRSVMFISSIALRLTSSFYPFGQTKQEFSTDTDKACNSPEAGAAAA